MLITPANADELHDRGLEGYNIVAKTNLCSFGRKLDILVDHRKKLVQIEGRLSVNDIIVCACRAGIMIGEYVRTRPAENLSLPKKNVEAHE